MSSIENNWFREINEQWEGYSVGLKVEKILYEGKSQYQDILVFKSTTFGNVLVLDGCIQCTERDECCYQEMIAHLPLACHANPKSVLVVGGGDGGVVREVLKHSSVEKVTLCEIDEAVIKICKQYLDSMARCLGDPRVHVHVGDGVKFMKEHNSQFDVIITDAPDPIGAAQGLYEEDYYRCLRSALKPGGIICSQGENLWLDLHIAKQLLTGCRKLFPRTDYAFASMPTYAGGQIGFVMASTNPESRFALFGPQEIDFRNPVHTYTDEDIDGMQLKFYNSQTHTASFVLPTFAEKVLHPKEKRVDNGVS